MKSPSRDKNKLCRRCNKNIGSDFICPACKNELIALYDNKIGWKTAFEIEKISKSALRNVEQEDTNDFI